MKRPILCGSHNDCTYRMGPTTQLNNLFDCVLNYLLAVLFYLLRVRSFGYELSQWSWNYCMWGCYKLLNFHNLYVQVEAFKWITVFHVHHRADIFSQYLTPLHSFVSCLWEVFLCCDFKCGFVTPWLRKWSQYWGLL